MLRAIHPPLAHYYFRAACGLPACPQTAPLVDWLRRQSFAPILGSPLTEENSKTLDFGMTSRLLSRVRDLTDPTTYGAALREALDADRIGIGYYNEARPIYQADIFAIDNQQRRTIHLGVDLFAAPDTPVFAPLAGTVHSLADYPQQQDYGPTLILKHEAADKVFFTLYGHLSPATLARLKVGGAGGRRRPDRAYRRLSAQRQLAAAPAFSNHH